MCKVDGEVTCEQNSVICALFCYTHHVPHIYINSVGR